jgi:hypothetical protein
MTNSVVNAGIIGANLLAVATSVATDNPFLEYIQNGASVAAVMSIFLWRECKRADRLEEKYNKERELRIAAESQCKTCVYVKRASEEFLEHRD